MHIFHSMLMKRMSQKEACDKNRLQFLLEEGDQVTNLHVFSLWQQSQERRNKWCYDNSVNAKSMRHAEELVNDLCSALYYQGIRIDRSVNIKKAKEVLPKPFFKSHTNNLAVYLGHERAGYMANNETCFMSPGSSLASLNVYPQVIVYEKVLKTTRPWLMGLLPVKQEWIEEAISDGRLMVHPLHQFETSILRRSTISGIGWNLFISAKIVSEVRCQHIEGSVHNFGFHTSTSYS